jgi:Lectin C-type domain
MELVSIETLAEHMAIVAEIGNIFFPLVTNINLKCENCKGAYDQSFWTSASDHDPQLIFYWESTGHAMGPFSNWAPGQPDNGASENATQQDCVALNSSDSYLWHDFDCKTNSLRYICEKRGENSSFGILIDF